VLGLALLQEIFECVPTSRLRREEIGTAATMKTIRGVPPSARYESGLVLANDDHVVVHGRFSSIGLTRD
jgi:hypothetical protein